MRYHIYKRTVTRDGHKPEVQWYYWYMDGDKRVRRSCGKDGTPCLLKRDAEAFVERLEAEQEMERKETLGNVVRSMFEENSDYLSLMEMKGKRVSEYTLGLRRKYVDELADLYADKLPSEFTPKDFDDICLKFKGRNGILNMYFLLLKEALKECVRRGLISSVPMMELPKLKSRKKDLLTKDEIHLLFPLDLDKLKDIWNVRNKRRYLGVDGKFHEKGVVIGMMFLIQLHCGMRPGEVRAVSDSQVGDGFIYLTQSASGAGPVVPRLKKGTAENPRHRVAILPSEVNELLRRYMGVRPAGTPFIFSFSDIPMHSVQFKRSFKIGLRHIEVNGRLLTPHSLRYTYNTVMVNHTMPGDVIRQIVGHRSAAMTDYYTRTDLSRTAEGLEAYRDMIDGIWKDEHK